MTRLELVASPLPRECATTAPHGHTLQDLPYRTLPAGVFLRNGTQKPSFLTLPAPLQK